MKKRTAVLTFSVVALAIIAAAVYILVLRNQNKSQLQILQKKVGFTIFIPSPTDTNWKLDENSLILDGDAGVLSFNVNRSDGSNKVIITEQATPDPFNDVPNYSSIFLSKLNQYQQLTVPLGSVALTHPSELKGGQSAVMNVRGTLMFMHPSSDMNDNEWKDFLRILQSV